MDAITIMNSVLLLAVIVLSIVNTVYISKLRKDYNGTAQALKDLEPRITKNMQTMEEKLNKAIADAVNKSVSVVDLAELKSLDGEAKAAYKKYVVDKIMPAVLTNVNRQIKDSRVLEDLKRKPEQVDKAIDQMVAVLQMQSQPPKRPQKN